MAYSEKMDSAGACSVTIPLGQTRWQSLTQVLEAIRQQIPQGSIGQKRTQPSNILLNKTKLQPSLPIPQTGLWPNVRTLLTIPHISLKLHSYSRHSLFCFRCALFLFSSKILKKKCLHIAGFMGHYIADSSKCPRIGKVNTHTYIYIYIYIHYDLGGWNNSPTPIVQKGNEENACTRGAVTNFLCSRPGQLARDIYTLRQRMLDFAQETETGSVDGTS